MMQTKTGRFCLTCNTELVECTEPMFDRKPLVYRASWYACLKCKNKRFRWSTKPLFPNVITPTLTPSSQPSFGVCEHSLVTIDDKLVCRFCGEVQV